MRRLVMLFGTFDLLHAGHIALFKQARHYGKQLVVVVARDQTVKKIKGRLPVHDERNRLALLKHIDLVDEAILGDKTDFYKVIGDIRPDVIALGYDQRAFVDGLRGKLKENKLKIKIVRLRAYQPRKMKSGKIRSYLSSFL